MTDVEVSSAFENNQCVVMWQGGPHGFEHWNPVTEFVRRVGKHQIRALAHGADPLGGIGSDNGGPVTEAEMGKVVQNAAVSGSIAFDERDVFGPPTQRLDAKGARTGEQVNNHGAIYCAPMDERVERRLTRSVRRGADIEPRRRHDLSPPCCSCNNPHGPDATSCNCKLGPEPEPEPEPESIELACSCTVGAFLQTKTRQPGQNAPTRWSGGSQLDAAASGARHAGAMDVLEAMATTRAIRRYRPGPIPEADLNTILWHATRAPTGSNRQGFRFVVLTDGPVATDAKALLGTAFRAGWQAKQQADGYGAGSGVDLASPKARTAAAMTKFVENFEQTPVVVLPCLIRHRAPDPTEGASIYPACQNLLLAARALGYGGVITGWHGAVDKELRELLKIPETVSIAACIPLGRPEGGHGPVRRRPIQELVFSERWGTAAPWAQDPDGTAFTSAGPPKPPKPPK